jgi:HEPN domain-containing protein
MFRAHELKYVAWQNRAFRFYIAARVLYRGGLFAPAAHSAVLSLELLLKATLVYWVRSFNPQDIGHAIAKMCRMVRNKVPSAKHAAVPTYFYAQQRYLTLSRYPSGGRGLALPASFLQDLDASFAEFITLVPFHHNTELGRALAGKNASMHKALRVRNRQFQILAAHLRVQVQ